jgi:YD repeat-containing protein
MIRIQFSERAVADSDRDENGTTVDYDAGGQVVGIAMADVKMDVGAAGSYSGWDFHLLQTPRA